MPIPRRKFEAEMVLGRELTGVGAEQADDQEDRSDDHMRAVEAGRHEESRTVDAVLEGEGRVRVFPGLNAGEGRAERDRQDQPDLQTLAIAMQKRVMGPSYRRA